MLRLPRIVLTSATAPLPPVDALIVEDDTHLVLGAPRVAVETDLDSVRLDGEAPAAGGGRGSAVVRGGSPTQISAIVHDLDDEPSWTEEAVALALDAALAHAHDLGVRSLAVQILGAVHGTMDPVAFGDLLQAGLSRHPLASGSTVWVLVPDGLDLPEL